MIQRLGKYRIIERIGRGGMGTVYKAHDPMLDRTVALKVISSDVDITDQLRTRFFREAQACARLSHPNVITVYDMGDEDGHLFIVMEFLEGEELRELIAQKRNVFLEDKLAMMIEVCDGLDYAHKRGIVHRDVKPGNIYVLKDGHVKLLDFGIARIATAEGGLTRTGLIMGTLRYMSPEQARGKVDHRSDIFSVGAVFYELLTYRHAFAGEEPMEILERLRSEDPTPLAEVDPSLPAELGEIIARSLKKDPGERYGELALMRGDLERVRRRLVEEAEHLRVRVRARFDEIRRLQKELTEDTGRSFEEETVPIVDERIRMAALTSLERESAVKAERLQQLVEQAAALRPDFDRAIQAMTTGDVDAAVRGLERIVAELPDHVRAADALRQAREAQVAARREAEERARQAEAARREAEERARREAEERARREAEERARAEAARREAEERARREAEARARREAEQAHAALTQVRAAAEELDAARHAVAPWSAAEAKASESRAAFDLGVYAESLARTQEAAELYRRAAEAARQVLERARSKAEEARKQAAAARDRAEKAGAPKHAAAAWAAAGTKLQEGAAAVERQEYDGAAKLFAEAEREHDGAAKVAREAVTAQARRVEALVAEARKLLETGGWADCLGRLEEALRLSPEHVEARDLSARAQAARAAADREQRRIAGLLHQARLELDQGAPGRCLEVLRGLGEIPATAAEAGAEAERLRDAAERALAAERAEVARLEAERRAREEAERQEAARREAEQRARREAERAQVALAEPRRQAEELEAARHAAPEWSTAEAKAREGRAAFERAAYAESVARSKEAGDLYRRAAEVARSARQELDRLRKKANEARKQAVAAREKAVKAEAPKHAAKQWSVAEDKQSQGVGALAEASSREVCEAAARFFIEAGREYERAAKAARDAAAAAERAQREAESKAAERRDAERRQREQAERAAMAERAAKAAREASAAREAEAVKREAVGAVAAAAEPDRGDALAMETVGSASRRRLLPVGIGLGAAAAVVLGLAVYWQTSSSRPIPPAPVAPAPSAPMATPSASPTAVPAQAVEALRKQVAEGRAAAAAAGAERLASATWNAAGEKERAAEAAIKQGDWTAARTQYSEALSAYGAASAAAAKSSELARRETDAQRAQEQASTGRRAAEAAGAPRLAKTVWAKAAESQRGAETALKQRDFERAETLFADSANGYREAEKQASEQKAAEAERTRLVAVRQKTQAAEEAATTAAGARRNAERAAASRYAPKSFALAQQKEEEARKGLDRHEYESAESGFREAAREYQVAIQEAQRASDAERQLASARQRQQQEAEQRSAEARRAAAEMHAKAQADREQAVKAGADVLTKDLFAAAATREGEGDRLAAGQDLVAAKQAYQDAAERYGEAGRRARVLQEAKAAADQARARMAADKQRARQEAPEFTAAVAQERQGIQHYQRLAFKEAGESFAAASDLFAKAAARPAERPPSRPAPADEVRGVLTAYVRAFETKDVALMQKIRPGLKSDEVRRLRESFDQSKEYRLSLKVDSLDVSGDQAIVKGRREDNLVSKGGQSFRNTSSFTFRLKRTGDGWVIDTVN